MMRSGSYASSFAPTPKTASSLSSATMSPGGSVEPQQQQPQPQQPQPWPPTSHVGQTQHETAAAGVLALFATLQRQQLESPIDWLKERIAKAAKE